MGDGPGGPIFASRKVRVGTDKRGRALYRNEVDTTRAAPSPHIALRKHEDARRQAIRSAAKGSIDQQAARNDDLDFRGHQAAARAGWAMDSARQGLTVAERDKVMPRDQMANAADRRPMNFKQHWELAKRMVENGFRNF